MQLWCVSFTEETVPGFISQDKYTGGSLTMWHLFLISRWVWWISARNWKQTADWGCGSRSSGNSSCALHHFEFSHWLKCCRSTGLARDWALYDLLADRVHQNKHGQHFTYDDRNYFLLTFHLPQNYLLLLVVVKLITVPHCHYLQYFESQGAQMIISSCFVNKEWKLLLNIMTLIQKDSIITR